MKTIYGKYLKSNFESRNRYHLVWERGSSKKKSHLGQAEKGLRGGGIFGSFFGSPDVPCTWTPFNPKGRHSWPQNTSSGFSTLFPVYLPRCGHTHPPIAHIQSNSQSPSLWSCLSCVPLMVPILAVCLAMWPWALHLFPLKLIYEMGIIIPALFTLHGDWETQQGGRCFRNCQVL